MYMRFTTSKAAKRKPHGCAHRHLGSTPSPSGTVTFRVHSSRVVRQRQHDGQADTAILMDFRFKVWTVRIVGGTVYLLSAIFGGDTASNLAEREGDSNPDTVARILAFQAKLFQPLRHLSGGVALYRREAPFPDQRRVKNASG